MVEKQGQKIRAGVSPPPFSGNAQKKTFFFQEGFPYLQFAFNDLSLLLLFSRTVWNSEFQMLSPHNLEILSFAVATCLSRVVSHFWPVDLLHLLIICIFKVTSLLPILLLPLLGIMSTGDVSKVWLLKRKKYFPAVP